MRDPISQYHLGWSLHDSGHLVRFPNPLVFGSQAATLSSDEDHPPACANQFCPGSQLPGALCAVHNTYMRYMLSTYDNIWQNGNSVCVCKSVLIRVATAWCTVLEAVAEPGWWLLLSSRILGWATLLLVSFVGHDAARETNYKRLDISSKRMRMKNTIFHWTKHLQVFDPVARIRKVHKSKNH